MSMREKLKSYTSQMEELSKKSDIKLVQDMNKSMLIKRK